MRKEKIASAAVAALKRTISAAKRGVLVVVQGLGVYLDDLLLIGGGGCFVRAAWLLLGRPWALVVAGACMVCYAVVIAMSRGGGGAR